MRGEMAEAHQARMQKEVEDMVQSLERDHIRKMQVGVSHLQRLELCMLCLHHMSHPSVSCLSISCLSTYLISVCLMSAGSHVQLQRRLLCPIHGLHVSGASVHREVSHSSGPSSRAGHLGVGEVSGERDVMMSTFQHSANFK